MDDPASKDAPPKPDTQLAMPEAASNRPDATTPDGLLFQQPTLGRHARKEHLFAPGKFGSYSYAIFARGDVPWPAKGVFTVLADQLRRGAGEWIVVPVSLLMRRTQMARSTVRTWIAWLHERRFIECRKRVGKPDHFSFAHPDDWPADPTRPQEAEKPAESSAPTCAEIGAGPPATSAPTCAETGAPTCAEIGAGPPASPAPTCAEIGAPTCAEIGAPTCAEIGAGPAPKSAHQDTKQPRQHTQEEPCVCVLAPQLLKEQIDDAHQAVFGSHMPQSWHDRIDKELGLKNSELLAKVDEAAVQRGRKLAGELKRAFGLGWVLRYLRNGNAKLINGKRHQEAQQAVVDQEQAARDAIRAQDHKIWVYFESLPDEQQDEFLKEAGSDPKLAKHPAAMKGRAAYLAWSKRPRAGVPG